MLTCRCSDVCDFVRSKVGFESPLCSEKSSMDSSFDEDFSEDRSKIGADSEGKAPLLLSLSPRIYLMIWLFTQSSRAWIFSSQFFLSVSSS